jgi:TP901 family phage tail tape measure protein
MLMLRGFNMEMTQANEVNDTYSELAAITAADTQEIAVAMSKTASIANNAGASFENMSAFLAQIIETTREAPETMPQLKSVA